MFALLLPVSTPATPPPALAARPLAVVDASGTVIGTLVPAGYRRLRLLPSVAARPAGPAAAPSPRPAFGPDYSRALSPMQTGDAYALWVQQTFAIDHSP